MRKLVLIDGHALLHRAFHALPPLSAPDGRPTNAVYGFLSVLLKMFADLKPDFVAATFDLAGPTFRHEQFEAYKAHRPKAPDELYAQIPTVKDLLASFGIPVYEAVGFEADDVIGTITEQTKTIDDLQTIVVTGDLDTLQLVHRKTVVVFTLRKGMSDTVTYDETLVRDRYGLSPAQVPDYKGLKGDPSDNIPGITGIGEKTASALIGTFGSLENLYEEIEKPAFAARAKSAGVSEKLKAKLLEQKDTAFFSKQLATISRNVPLAFSVDDADWRRNLDLARLESECRSLGFTSLLKRISAVVPDAARQAAAQTLDLNGTQAPAMPPPARIAPERAPDGDQVAVAFSVENGRITRMLGTNDGVGTWELSDPTPERCQALLGKYRRIIGHDTKTLVRLLPEPSALSDRSFLDTEIGAWLLEPHRGEYAPERVYADVTTERLPEGLESLPAALWRLWPLLEGRLKASGLLKLWHDLESPLIGILSAMEHLGIRVDTRTIDDLLVIANTEVADLEKRIHKYAGGPFNINSPSQLAEILFTKLAIRGRVRRTSGGAPSTAAPELEKLRDEHSVVDLVLQYRELSKMKTTYIEPFPSLIAADGRIHTTYHQTGTATGRLSSSDPNLQNIPTRTELGQKFRAAFVADPGWKLLSLDYSQLELRLVAHIARDETMMAAFRAGEDIHTRTASEVFGVAPGAVTRDMRRQAKVLNFGIIYGMGSMGFARAASVSRDDARRFIDEYLRRFSGVALYMERTKKEAAEHGFVATLLGRRRPLPDINSGMPQLAAAAERMAINHPIQGTGADLMKLAMIAVDRHVRDTGLANRARILLQVHDELVLEVRSNELEEITRAIRNLMENVYALDIPLIVDAKAGDNWARMEPLERV